VSQFYEIKVKKENGKAVDICWRVRDKDKLHVRFSGAYKLRTSRTELSKRKLRQRGISKLWKTIRRELSTIIRVTTT